MLLKTDLINALKFVSHAAAKKDVRYYLNGVLFEFNNEELILIGCDGHRIAHAKIEHKSTLGGLRVAVSNDDIKKLLSFLDFHSDEEIEITPKEKGFSVSCGWATDGIDGTYPDWRRIVPQKKEPTAQTALQCGYVEEAAKALKILAKAQGGKFAAVRMEFHGETTASIFRLGASNSLDAFVVIMPIRV